MKTKILLAEDDKNLGSVLKTYLEAKGYTTTLCMDGKQCKHNLNYLQIPAATLKTCHEIPVLYCQDESRSCHEIELQDGLPIF